MTKPYQLSIPTGIEKDSKRVLATVDKACGSGSGSGGDCIGIDCRVCVSYTLDFTFGGALSAIGVITITGIDTGSEYKWADPPTESPTAVIDTPCGGLRIFFQISYDGAAALQVRLNGVLIVSRTSSMRVCEPFTPGDPTEFIYPQPLVDGSAEEGYGPDFTVSGNEDGCNGDASITVTNTSDGDGSGSTNPYDFAIDTLITKEGLRVLAAVDCAAAGSGPNLYWYGYDSGIRKNGKRVLVGYNPCCNDGPTFRLPWTCAETECTTIPNKLYLTLSWNNTPSTATGPPATKTITLNYLPLLSVPSVGSFAFLGYEATECGFPMWIKATIVCESGLGYVRWKLCFTKAEPAQVTPDFYECPSDANYCGFLPATVSSCVPHYASGTGFLTCGADCSDSVGYVEFYISEVAP